MLNRVRFKSPRTDVRGDLFLMEPIYLKLKM